MVSVTASASRKLVAIVSLRSAAGCALARAFPTVVSVSPGAFADVMRSHMRMFGSVRSACRIRKLLRGRETATRSPRQKGCPGS